MPWSADRSCRQNEFAFLERKNVAPHDARGLHPAGDPDHEHDQNENPCLGAELRSQLVAKQEYNHKQQGKQGKSEEKVGESHEKTVQPFDVSGYDADQCPED